MTIQDAITQADDLQRNTYTIEHKITWLSRLEDMVKKQVIDLHEGAEDAGFEPVTGSTDMSHVLFIPAPYDEAYIHWICAQVNYNNNELDRYNASITMFTTLFEAFKREYTRQHKPLNPGSFRF